MRGMPGIGPNSASVSHALKPYRREKSFAKLARLISVHLSLMSLVPGLAATRSLCALVGVCLWATFVHAQVVPEPQPPDEEAITLDQTTQALKDELVQFNRDAQLAEDEFLYPPHTRLSVYVSNQVEGFLLQEVRVAIDDGEPLVYTYDEHDSRALLGKDALQRLIQVNVDRGAHRVKADFRGQRVDAEEGDPPLIGNHEAIIDKTLDPAEVELQIVANSRRRHPMMQVKEWRVEQ